jgi:hypothetical protein
MTDTTTLDAAIGAAQEQVYNNQERVVDPLDRTYARALLTAVWEHVAMARKPYSLTKGGEYNAGVVVGFETAVRTFRQISCAGLEVES